MTPDKDELPVIPSRQAVAICGECGRKIYYGQEWPCGKEACPISPNAMRFAGIARLTATTGGEDG